MLAEVTNAFDDFVGRLSLSPVHRRTLHSRRDVLRGYLADEWDVRRVLFGGSHARGTKISPVGDKQGDLDVYFVLAPRLRWHYGMLSGHTPSDLLIDVRQTLKRHLSTPSLRADSPCVRIRYSDLDVDVIPAFESWLDSSLLIPYYKGWLRATPDKQRKLFTSLNQRQGARFLPMVKMIKHWNRVHPTAGLRSYHTEIMALRIFRLRDIESYASALVTYFEKAARLVTRPLSDPCGSRSAVTQYLSPEKAAHAQEMLQRAARLAQAARDEESPSRAIDAWRSDSLFGPRFPASGD